MIDICRLLSALTQLVGGSDFPNAKTLAAVLDLDMSQATITKTKQGNLGVNGARLGGSNIGIACGIIPRREIWILFDNSPISYLDIKNEMFGANQRIQPSRRSKGFAVVFDICGLTCGYTADSQKSNVDAIFCEAPVSKVPVT